MSYLYDFIVYLWLLPVVMCIVIPLGMFVAYWGNRILRKISGHERTVSAAKPIIGKRRVEEVDSSS